MVITEGKIALDDARGVGVNDPKGTITGGHRMKWMVDVNDWSRSATMRERR